MELGPRSRVVFAAVYVAAQASLVLTASRRPDRAFGFQMFSESSTIRYSLSRVLRAEGREASERVVPATNGDWSVKGPDGYPRKVSWRDRVKEPALATFDTTMHASYGADAQLQRLQAALDDVARHTPDDRETKQLVMDVTVRKNGGDPYVVHLASAERR